jgi:hypothetical protein
MAISTLNLEIGSFKTRVFLKFYLESNQSRSRMIGSIYD